METPLRARKTRPVSCDLSSVMARRNTSRSSPQHRLFSISFTQPKMRIKFPPVLVKTMQRRRNKEHDDDHEEDGTKMSIHKWEKHGVLLANKFRLLFSDVFGRKKSTKETYFSSGTDDTSESISVDSPNDGKEYMVSIGEGSGSSRDSKSRQIQLSSDEDEDDDEDSEDEGRPLQRNLKKKPSGPKSLSAFSIFRKGNTNMNLSYRGKVHDANADNEDKYDARGSSGNNGSITGWQKSYSSSFSSVSPEGVVLAHRRFSISFRVEKMEIKRMIEEEEGKRGDQELCRKRILMGEKCKPLSYSGNLNYDKNGMPLPEI